MNKGTSRKLKSHTDGKPMPEDYDPSYNYMNEHLRWIKENKNFIPKRGLIDPKKSYYDEMLEYYQEAPTYHETTYFLYRDDAVYLESRNKKTVTEAARELFKIEKHEERPATYFVTWNFEEQYFLKNKNKIEKNLNKFLNNKWLINGRAVFEYHTKNGNHPHIMALLETKKYSKIYDFKDAVFQLALSKDLARNFIDIKYSKVYHTDYINLDKADCKKEFLLKDIEWRKAQGLEEEYKRE